MRSGVDIEIFLGSKRWMLDFTIIHATCPSYVSSSYDSLIQSKTKEKVRKYVDSGMIPREELVVAIIWSHGALHKDLVDFLRRFASEARIDFTDLVDGVRNCAMWGQGASVSAAFRTVGAAAYSRAVHM